VTIVRRAFARSGPEQQRVYLPSGAGDPWAIPSNGSLAAYTSSGVPVTEDTAMQLGAVWACVRILSTALSGLPLDAVRMMDVDGYQIRKTLEPPPPIISDPFGGANNVRFPSRRKGISQMMVSLLLRGNAYALITARDYLLRPTRMQVLHPDRVGVGLDDDGGKTFKVNRKTVPPEDMVHLVGMCMPESPVGMSVITALREAIGLGLAAQEFGARFFGRGSHMSGIVEVPGDLDNDRARQLKERMESKHAGLSNSHTLGILTGGATFKPISISPEDAQFLGTRAAQNLDMAMVFGVPPHMLGQVDRTTSWGTGIEQQSLGFLKYTLSEWVGGFEDAWSAMLPRPQVAKFNLDALLRTDTAGRYAVYTQARNIAALTIDEIRAMEDRPPYPDGKGADPFAPLNSAHTDTPTADPGAVTPKSASESGMEP
jgi:HK97 family phage portal protein